MKAHLAKAALFLVAVMLYAPCALAQEADGAGQTWIPFGVAIIMGLAAFGGTTAQGRAISAGLDSIGRNPSASGKIQTPMIVGLAFVESLVIIAFVVAFLMLGKLPG